jgi:nickel-dependent lactate racemase
MKSVEAWLILRQRKGWPIDPQSDAWRSLRRRKPVDQLTVAIAVSDITRPVPYKGDHGILTHILRRLESSGIQKKNIKIIVGPGTHRLSTAAEKVEMYGESVVAEYTVVDHNCEDTDSLTYIGKTRSGTKVYLNSLFHQSDSRSQRGWWRPTS